MNFKKIGIIGGGCFGTALAECFSKVTEAVKIVEKNPQIIKSINENHVNEISLPKIKLNKNIICIDSIENISDTELIFLVVPVKYISDICLQIKNSGIKSPIISCSKGFDLIGKRLISDLLIENLSNDIFILSGPSFAAEIASGLPATVNLAGKNYELCEKLAKDLSSDNLKIEAIQDFIGLQIAGALKNVLAIGCGILFGKNLGQSAVSTFIVKGIHEMMHLSEILGGDKNTFSKIGALGDIILTCTSSQSRNMKFGMFIAGGGKLENWNGSLAEGVFASTFIPSRNLPLKIFQNIHDVIYNKISVEEFLKDVFNRNL